MMRRAVSIVAALAFGASIACGGGGEVLVKGFRFQPDVIAVAVSDTVTWEQSDDTLHTITAGTPGDATGEFDRRDFGRGETFSFAFAEAGTFRYFCVNHPEGMRGTVRVQ